MDVQELHGWSQVGRASFSSAALILPKQQFLHWFLAVKYCCDLQHLPTRDDAQEGSWVLPQVPFLRQWNILYLLAEQSSCVIQWDTEDADNAVSPGSFKLPSNLQGGIVRVALGHWADPLPQSYPAPHGICTVFWVEKA